MLIFVADGFLDKPSVTLQYAERHTVFFDVLFDGDTLSVETTKKRGGKLTRVNRSGTAVPFSR